ncbi:uncharacterized protein L969DRAFT_15802 [Mixia osmundae IAM 14324]|uniref:RED-like N-terminal domain-containing protein n=1 Tax=Mixia osmundae (strain CBS 9802 / IAM 14324 / JCM 22182 / KY 12970) TaxID=764103 RepID=G7E6D9_MIXOS|nr:uncharacterized protein L969DRAFT_15802 [Mixia osmundae IAM 14324]KEI40444.1 hypothetical protein L969DRAFT_15802 [Mixia osmundae IAM 14324]GAA98399.1 hypothetical protein E5Q_05085 [Mixia osmundae IAM 14324]
MDQDAFRALLQSAPSSATLPGREYQPRPTTKSSRFDNLHGLKYRKQQESTTDNPYLTSLPSTSLLPRSAARGKSTVSTTKASVETASGPSLPMIRGKYVDRAAARRMGFSDLDLEPQAGMTSSEHADDLFVLDGQGETGAKRGLDLDLLAKEQARLAQQDSEQADDELDNLLVNDKGPVASHVLEPATRKRSRDEIIADLKAKRASQVGPSEDRQQGAAPSKFKKLSAVSSSVTPQERPKRKKQKAVKPAVALQPIAPDVLAKADKNASHTAHDGPSREASSARVASLEGEASARKPELVAALSDDDDIFAGAGDYTGYLSAEDDMPKTTTERTVGAPTEQQRRKDWFEAEQRRKTVADEPKEATAMPQIEPDNVLSDDEREEQRHEPLRLQPLSSTSYNIKELLALDQEEARKEKRKAKKLKYAKGDEKPEKILSEKDKLNRDHQQMTRYLEKRETDA